MLFGDFETASQHLGTPVFQPAFFIPFFLKKLTHQANSTGATNAAVIGKKPAE